MILKHLICTLKVEMRQHAQARTICPANNYNLWRHLIGISNFLWPYRIQIQIQLIIFVFGFPNYKHVRWAMNAAGSNGWLRHFEKFARWQAKHKNKFCLNGNWRQEWKQPELAKRQRGKICKKSEYKHKQACKLQLRLGEGERGADGQPHATSYLHLSNKLANGCWYYKFVGYSNTKCELRVAVDELFCLVYAPAAEKVFDPPIKPANDRLECFCSKRMIWIWIFNCMTNCCK